MSYKAIAFDLDDTLIDTTNELIPFACRKIHTYLVSQGYAFDFEKFDSLRKRSITVHIFFSFSPLKIVTCKPEK